MGKLITIDVPNGVGKSTLVKSIGVKLRRMSGSFNKYYT